MRIIKRSGVEEDFNSAKIISALNRANAEVEGDDKLFQYDVEGIARAIEQEAKTIGRPLNVEEIQDMVEDSIMSLGKYALARKYIKYRQVHSMSRDKYDDLMKAVADKLLGRKIDNQNANVDEHSFGGRMGEANDVVCRQFALDFLVSEKAKKNHIDNRVYIHDLNSYAVGNHNCLSVPFDDLLANGFVVKQTDVRPAGSLNTAFQLVAVIFQLQSLQQFGGVSATHLDWTMVPYVRKSFYKHFMKGVKYIENFRGNGLDIYNKQMAIDDKKYRHFPKAYEYAIDMTKEECHQAVEGMYHNLNTLQSRSGNQLPFTSINYGTCTLPEGRMVTKAVLDLSIEGLGKLNRTSIFPCGIFQCMKGVNRHPGDPNYDLFRLALKSTALRLYPNYCNVDWSGNAGYDVNDPRTYFSTMGCRTANGYDINGLGQLKDGRGNICPTTIILPTLAMEAKKKIQNLAYLSNSSESEYDLKSEFLSLLDEAISDARDALIERYKWICSQSPDSAKFMYENNLMAGYIPEEGIESALKHGTLAIGQIGLAETLQILLGCDHTSREGMDFAKEIECLFNKRCKEFKESYHLNFGVYYTPAENLCYTAMKKFRDKYGVIKDVSDKEFFTNSIHVPVWKDADPFEKIDIESQLTGYSNAGCITYVELGSSCKHNLDALETLVNYAMDKDVPYFAINVPNDQCMECGYCDEMNDTCPKCGSKDIKRLRRVTGYLTNDYKTSFNKGKQQEVEMRVKHDSF
nr:MAG TPA: anaerobic ribonucleoside triphosphate reductase [Bacteriophage sp.]